jgi:hypothetical protein
MLARWHLFVTDALHVSGFRSVSIRVVDKDPIPAIRDIFIASQLRSFVHLNLYCSSDFEDEPMVMRTVRAATEVALGAIVYASVGSEAE